MRPPLVQLFRGEGCLAVFELVIRYLGDFFRVEVVFRTLRCHTALRVVAFRGLLDGDVFCLFQRPIRLVVRVVHRFHFRDNGLLFYPVRVSFGLHCFFRILRRLLALAIVDGLALVWRLLGVGVIDVYCYGIFRFPCLEVLSAVLNDVVGGRVVVGRVGRGI